MTLLCNNSPPPWASAPSVLPGAAPTHPGVSGLRAAPPGSTNACLDPLGQAQVLPPCTSPTHHTESLAWGAVNQPPQHPGSTGQRDTIILYDEIRCNMKYALGVDESAGSGDTNTSAPPLPKPRPRAALTPQQLPAQPLPPFLAEDSRRAQSLPCPAPVQLSSDQDCCFHRPNASHVPRQAWGPLEVLLSS